jgi:hypothetical protein
MIVILAIAWAVLAGLNSNTKKAPPYSRTVTTPLSREQVINFVERSIPKSIISKSFNWQSSWQTSDKFAMSGHYLTNGQGCVTLLLTGIIPGYLIIKFAMERSEEMAIDFSKFEDAGELQLDAKGLRARREVEKLAERLANPPPWAKA